MRAYLGSNLGCRPLQRICFFFPLWSAFPGSLWVGLGYMHQLALPWGNPGGHFGRLSFPGRRHREIRGGGIKGLSTWPWGSASPAAHSFHSVLLRPIIHSLFQQIPITTQALFEGQEHTANKPGLTPRDRASAFLKNVNWRIIALQCRVGFCMNRP